MRINILLGRLLVCLLVAHTPASHAASEEATSQFKTTYAQYLEAFNRGAFAESLPLAQQTLEAGRLVYGKDSKSFATLHLNLGINLLLDGQYPEALASLEDTLDIFERVFEKDAPEFIDLYLNLADAERTNDFLSDWTRYNRDALGIARKTMGKDSTVYAFLLLDVGHSEFVNQGRDGERRIEEGYKILVNTTPEPAQIGYAHFLKGKIEMAHERYDSALHYLNNSVQKIRTGPSPIDNKLLMTALGFITVALEETGQSSLANDSLAEIGLIKAKLGDTSVEPVYRVNPEFPGNIDLTTTGTLLNVKKMNEGKVSIKFDVDEKGYTINHSVIASVGKRSYVLECLKVIKKYRYAPRFVNGQPVIMTGVQQDFTFLLDI